MSLYDKHSVTARFVTPAFLGGADGSELRTPPFKSLLRRWWRIVQVGGQTPDLPRLREQEGLLFGHAWLEHDGSKWAAKSSVRLRLAEWKAGDLAKWSDHLPVFHEEVRRHGQRVDSLLYLGYGPLVPDARSRSSGTALKAPPAIRPGTQCELTLHIGRNARDTLRLDDIVLLWQWFGTIGSRSRNAWGSLDVSLAGRPDNRLDTVENLERFGRDFDACFDSDWPHALGRDERGLLVWRTRQEFPTWQGAMKALAEMKIAIRTARQFTRQARVDRRHVLAYPVTNHAVEQWNNEAFRLANQLVLKVLRVPGARGDRFVGLAAHFPHRVPAPMADALAPTDRDFIRKEEGPVWRGVHRELDALMQRWQ